MSKFKKIIICKHYENNSCKFMNTKELCSYAHGENDIIKNKCFNGINCFDEKCNYEHPEDWNPENNKLYCIFCDKGFCNKENTKYKHININDNIKEDNKDIILDIPKNKDFPEIIKNKTINNENIKSHEYKYSDILKSSINNCKEKEINDENLKEIEKNIKKKLNINSDNNIKDIKKQLEGNYILLSKLDHKNWSNYEEIDNIKDDINKLEDKYNNLKKIDKKVNILDNDLNLNTIFNENNNEYKEDIEDKYIPNIYFNITYEENKDIDDNIHNLIKNMEKDFKIYIKKIKINLNDTIKNEYLKIMLINNLNKIQSKINLFENNYKDIIKNYEL